MILKFIKKVINPKFLQDIDYKYLLNYPRLWTLKIHYLCYYVGIIDSLLLIGLCFYRFKIYHTSRLVILLLLVLGLNSIGIISWSILQFYYNIAYNPEKQFGIINIKNNFFLIFLVIACVCL